MGAIFQRNFFEDNITSPFAIKDYSEDIFTAIFVMMFGAMAAGQAQQFGPDLGKAKSAAAKIFGIIDVPTEIDVNEASKRQVD